MKKGKILITGSAGFIGFSLSRSFLKFGYNAVGIDNINSYYSKALKLDRIKILKKFKKFRFYKADLRNKKRIKSLFIKNKIDTVYHLAAQAVFMGLIKNYHFQNQIQSIILHSFMPLQKDQMN